MTIRASSHALTIAHPSQCPTPAPPVPDGEYSAMPVEISQMKGPCGPMVKIDFQINSEDKWEGRRVSGVASKKLGANTKLGTWNGSQRFGHAGIKRL